MSFYFVHIQTCDIAKLSDDFIMSQDQWHNQSRCGATTEIPSSHITPLCGQTIVNLNAGDLVAVYVTASDATHGTIPGVTSLFTADNTSTSITIRMV